MSALTDEKLLKRARNGGRNLAALAILGSIGLAAVLLATVFAAQVRGMMAVLSLVMSAIVAGYWMLAVSAKRGNVNAIATVMVFMALQIVLVMIAFAISAIQSNGNAAGAVLPSVVIPLLLMLALSGNRKDLLELKKRGLWEQVFGSAKPSGNLCIIGAVLLAAGFLGLNGYSMVSGFYAGRARALEGQSARKFVQLVKTEEQEFLKAASKIYGPHSAEDIDQAILKATILEKQTSKLVAEAGNNKALSTILQDYHNATKRWKEGVALLKSDSPDSEQTQKLLQLGDRLHKQAVEAFDARYATPNTP